MSQSGNTVLLLCYLPGGTMHYCLKYEPCETLVT